MTLLILGLLLWSIPHLYKRIAPAQRASLPDGMAKGIVTAASFAGIALMVIGYDSGAAEWAYTPPSWGKHANNLLVLIAVYFAAASGMKTALARKLRHPLLMAAVIWAVGHLLVRGDWMSIVLFGGLATWAILSMVLINMREPSWTPPSAAPKGKEIGAAVGAILVTGVIGYIHILLGLNPFGA